MSWCEILPRSIKQTSFFQSYFTFIFQLTAKLNDKTARNVDTKNLYRRFEIKGNALNIDWHFKGKTFSVEQLSS